MDSLLKLLPAWGWALLATFVLLAIYIIIIKKWFVDIIKSRVVPKDATSIECDQLYFLPEASVTLTVTAKVAVARNAADNSFVKATIYELAFDPQIQLQADGDALMAINYQRSWFSADELRLTTNPSGLLESLAVTTEDRISAIVSQVTDAPKKILTGGAAALIAPPLAVPVTITNLPPFVKSFVLSPEILAKPTEIFDWEISIDGAFGSSINLIDASFKVTFPKPLTTSATVGNGNSKSLGGIFTRPLRNLQIDIRPNKTQDTSNRVFTGPPQAILNLMVPDRSKTFRVPFKRVLFSKSIESPKFSSGLLTENYINKPSELESLVSIPINIAKAVFSIPAQLLSFKIAHIQQQTSFETESQKLLAARLLNDKTKKDSDDQLQKLNIDAKKADLGVQQSNLNLQKDLVNAQQNWETAKKELQTMLAQIEAEKTKQ